MKTIITFLSCVLTALTSLAAEPATIIHAGKLLAVPGEMPLENQTIVVRNGAIDSVRSGFLSAEQLGIENTEVIDLGDRFVLPGLIDMHTHITGERDPERNPHEWTTRYEASVALEATQYLRRTLEAGVTTVRNVGADHKVILPLKNAVEMGWIEGPRIIAATGGVTPTGGHGDMHGYREEITALYPRVGVCDGADDCRRAVRALVKQGAEVIKITATGGVLSNTAAGVGQQLTDDELAAIVGTAHSLGRKVAAHAHAAGGINAALRAGVDSIEHGSFLNEESVRLFRETGAYLVPTLLAGVSIGEELETNENIPPAIMEKIAQVAPAMRESFQRALEGEVKIAFGTDSAVSRHGQNARELVLMVEYGMEPSRALRAATVEASRLLGMEGRLGTIEAGKAADIIAVDGNPIDDINEMLDVDWVMKGGKVLKD